MTLNSGMSNSSARSPKDDKINKRLDQIEQEINNFGTVVNTETVNADNVNALGLDADIATIDSATIDSANIRGVSITDAGVSNLSATNAQLPNIQGNVNITGNLSASNANIAGTVKAHKLDITDRTLPDLTTTTSNTDVLNATDANVANLKVTGSATFDNGISLNSFTADNIGADDVVCNTLQATAQVTTDEVSATNVVADNVNTVNGTATNITSENVTAQTVNSVHTDTVDINAGIYKRNNAFYININVNEGGLSIVKLPIFDGTAKLYFTKDDDTAIASLTIINNHINKQSTLVNYAQRGYYIHDINVGTDEHIYVALTDQADVSRMYYTMDINNPEVILPEQVVDTSFDNIDVAYDYQPEALTRTVILGSNDFFEAHNYGLTVNGTFKAVNTVEPVRWVLPSLEVENDALVRGNLIVNGTLLSKVNAIEFKGIEGIDSLSNAVSGALFREYDSSMSDSDLLPYYRGYVFYCTLRKTSSMGYYSHDTFNDWKASLSNGDIIVRLNEMSYQMVTLDSATNSIANTCYAIYISNNPDIQPSKANRQQWYENLVDSKTVFVPISYITGSNVSAPYALSLLVYGLNFSTYSDYVNNIDTYVYSSYARNNITGIFDSNATRVQLYPYYVSYVAQERYHNRVELSYDDWVASMHDGDSMINYTGTFDVATVNTDVIWDNSSKATVDTINKAQKDSNGNIITDTYETITDAYSKFVQKSHIGYHTDANVTGVCPLDSNGLVPVERMPTEALIFKGLWKASTNTPALADGVGTKGDYYISSDAGSVDFGHGVITFSEGDTVIYDGSLWHRVASGMTRNELVNTIGEATSVQSGLESAADKTKLDGIEVGAEVNVQADWTEADSSNDAYIKNKPNFSAVATSGNFDDLVKKPTISVSGKTISLLNNDGSVVSTGTVSGFDEHVVCTYAQWQSMTKYPGIIYIITE